MVGCLYSMDATELALYHVTARSVFKVAPLVSVCQKRAISVSLSEAWLRWLLRALLDSTLQRSALQRSELRPSWNSHRNNIYFPIGLYLFSHWIDP